MSQQETVKPGDELEDSEYVDFSNGAAVEKALKKAFNEYQWPAYKDQPKDRKWSRDKKGKLHPKVKNVGERRTTMFNFERCSKALALAARAFPIKQIADVIGVQERTIYGWVKRGEQEGKGPFWIFAKALMQLRSAYETRLQSVVHAFTFKGGRTPTEAEAEMALKQLRYRFPNTWGQSTVDVTSGGKPIGDGGKVSTIAIKFMKPGKDGPEMVEPPQSEEKSIFEDDEG